MIYILKSSTFAANMRRIAFILSLLIFHQSLSVCGPKFTIFLPISQQTECITDKPTKSCCAKKETKHDNHKEKDGCCGDNCKCLTCAKVFLNSLNFTEIKWIEEIEITKKIIYPVFVHSYEFYPSIAYPPNV